MTGTSPLHRAAEQPPCDASAEGLALNAMFAVPARMDHFDLTPHLVFVEHRAIWRSMRRVVDGDPDWFWLRTLRDLQREYTPAAAMRLLRVLDRSAQYVVRVLNREYTQDVVDGELDAMIFVLALAKLRRCTAARCELSALQERATRLWRVPGTPYSAEEKRRLLGPATIRIDV